MMKKLTAQKQLKQILVETGFDCISDYGYKLLVNAGMLNNVDQARVMSQIVKDVSTIQYAAGYSDGRVEQAKRDEKEKNQGDSL